MTYNHLSNLTQLTDPMNNSELYTKEAVEVGSSIGINDKSVKAYKYNLLNQQISVVTGNGVTEYTYNASGLRDSKKTGTETTSFYWDGSNIVGEAKNGTIVASYTYCVGLINREDKVTDEKNYYFFNVTFAGAWHQRPGFNDE